MTSPLSIQIPQCQTPDDYDSINDAVSDDPSLASNSDCEHWEEGDEQQVEKVPWPQKSSFKHTSIVFDDPFASLLASDLPKRSTSAHTSGKRKDSLLSDLIVATPSYTVKRRPSIASDLATIKRMLHNPPSEILTGPVRRDSAYSLVPPAGTTSPDLCRASDRANTAPSSQSRHWTRLPPRGTWDQPQHKAPSTYGGTEAEKATIAAFMITCDEGTDSGAEIIPKRQACSEGLGPPPSGHNEPFHRSPIFS